MGAMLQQGASGPVEQLGHRNSKCKTTVFMIDGSFPKQSFIGPK
jgi:hypothetical protein